MLKSSVQRHRKPGLATGSGLLFVLIAASTDESQGRRGNSSESWR